MVAGRLRIAGAAVALGMLLGVGVVAYRTIVDFPATQRWVAHAHEVLDSVQATVGIMKDAEIAVRGYLVTGDDDLDERREIARPALVRLLDRLRALVADDPEQSRNLEELDAAIRAKLAYSDDVIDQRRARHLGREELQGRLAEGMRRIDEIQNLAIRVSEEERRLLAAREDALATSTQRTLTAMTGGAVLGVTLLLGALWLMQREVRQRTRRLEALGSFAHAASRDLRAIDGDAHVLIAEHAEALDDESRRVLDVIRTSARRMERSIDDLLSRSRLEPSELELPARPGRSGPERP